MPVAKPVPVSASATPSGADAVPDDVETRILAAALELFAERGFASTTTAEVARRAGVAEKTIFAHFKTKDALFERTLTPATVDLLVPQVKTPLQVLFDDSAHLEDFLLALMRNRVELFRRHPTKFKLIVQELLLRPERARRFASEIDEPFHAGIEATFRRFQRKGELRDMPLSRLHRIFLSAVLGYSISRVIIWPDLDWDDDAEMRATVSALVDGLRPCEDLGRASPVAKPRAKRPPRSR